MKVVTPEHVGFSTTRLGRIGRFMQHYVAEQKLAGVMTLVARQGQIVHWQSFGRRDLAANKPLERDTIFRIYSMTKPITSVAAMMLYEQGHFLLDDPLAGFMPEFKAVKVYLGFGIIVDAKRSGALGSDGMFSWGGLASTHFWLDPQEDLLAILMTQLLPSGHYPIHLQFRTLTYQALVG
jgi:CubicO group peptidase (beta-lactamase class C family)